jgi:PAS domain S-box-containing protein
MTGGQAASPDPATLIRAGDEITDLLGTARDLHEVAPELLRVLMRTYDWDGGFVLALDSQAGVLRSIHTHWRERLRLSANEDPALHEPVVLQGTLAGRALQTLHPVWCEAAAKEQGRVRAQRLAAGGVHTYLAVPVVYAGIGYGLLELVSGTIRREDLLYETWVMQVAKQLGQFVERSAAMRAAVRSRRSLDDLFANAPVGILVLDAQGNVQRANERVLAKLGVSREEILGRPWREFHADPATADELLARVGREPDHEVVAPEVVLRSRDGSLRWVHFSANARLDEGRAVQQRLFLRDLTEVRRAEASARESQERYRRLVEGARDYALHALDGQGRVTGWNPGAQRMYGWAEEEILGRDFAASFTPEDRADDVPGRLLRLTADEGRFRHEGWRQRKDGTRFPVEVLYTALRDASGQLVEISQLTRDVSERERLAELRRRSAQLEAANREVISGARDDAIVLQRIADAIQGPIDALAHLSGGSGNVPAAAVEAGVRDLRDALRELEAVGTRPPSDTTAGSQAADLRVLAQEVADLLAVPANERRLRIEMSVDADLPAVGIDPARVRQLLYNLLAHAIRSSRERGVVHLAVQAEGDAHVRIQVEDCGIGHSEEELAELFSDEGARLGETEAPSPLLPATRRIAEQDGGRVGAHSTPGHGTVLFAVLPSVAARTHGGTAHIEVRDRRVLALATDPWTRAKLCWTLGNAGYDVVSADDPNEALALAHESRYEIVAVDLRLDQMEPLDFVATLRAEGASREAPCVIAVLGSRDFGVAGLLVTDMLPRPTPADRLFAALERARVARGTQSRIVVVDGDAALLRASARSLELLGYRAAPEQDGNAALREIAQERPAAILLSPFLKGVDPFWFLHHLRRLPTAREVPVFLAVPRGLTAEQLKALEAGAGQAAEEGLWHQGLILEAAARECPKQPVSPGAEEAH